MPVKNMDSKAPWEIVPVTFNFEKLVTTIDSATVTVSVRVGTDPSPIDLIFSSPITNGHYVQQLIQGGIDGVIYRIRADITSGNEKYSLAGYLPVVEVE